MFQKSGLQILKWLKACGVPVEGFLTTLVTNRNFRHLIEKKMAEGIREKLKEYDVEVKINELKVVASSKKLCICLEADGELDCNKVKKILE